MKTTHSIWGLLEDELPLEPLKGDGFNIKNSMLIEISEDTDDGTYSRVSDYMRFANSLENSGASAFLNRCSRKKNKKVVDFMGAKIIRDADYRTAAIIEFTNPINVIIGHVGDRPIIEKVKKIKGEFTHEWFWKKNGRQNKIANGFEIWFNIEGYIE